MSVITENLKCLLQENKAGLPVFDLDNHDEEPFDKEDVLFSIYNDILPEEKKTKQEKEWSLRITCMQEWFIRCSWINKYLFIETLCLETKGFAVLEETLKSIKSIYSKDVLESLLNESTNYPFDRIPLDDNRTLDPSGLRAAMKNDFLWFSRLTPDSQTRVLLRLLKLGGGGLIFMVYNFLKKLHKERQEEIETDTETEETVSEVKTKSSVKKIESRINPNGTFHLAKLKELERRDSELTKYKKMREILEVESKTPKKKIETKESIDLLQILPIHLNRKIMSYIDDKRLSGLKKVGKYWSKMIDESINERSGRKAINAKINKIVGIEVDEEEKKIEEEEAEFITELGAQEFIRRKNESEVLNNSQFYKNVLSGKCKTTILDTLHCPGRCGVYEKSLGILACSSPNNMVHFYSVRTGARLDLLAFGFESPITCLALHENRIHMFFGCGDGSLISKDIRTNKTTGSFNGHTNAVISIFTTPSNLLSASLDNTIKYFQLWSGLCLLRIDLSPDLNISSVIFENDEEAWIGIGTVEGTFLSVDIKAKKFLAKVKLHNEEIKQLAHDEDILITASGSGKIRIWNIKQLGDNFPTLKPYYNINMQTPILSLKFYKNQIFCGCKNGTLKIISLATGNVWKTMKISTQTPVRGIDVAEDKLFMKLIIWHEKGIEIRSFSLQKSSSKKMPLRKDNRENKQKAPKESHRNKTSEMNSVDENFGFFDEMIKTTFWTGKRPLKERCCTSSIIRTKGKCSYQNQDVFTLAYNEQTTKAENDFVLCTFKRQCPDNKQKCL